MTPEATVICILESKSTRGVVVRCPFCRKTHQHGWPYGVADIGDRVSHCFSGQGRNYYVPTPVKMAVAE